MFVYAKEADVINVVLFGMTAKECREQNPNLDGNIRDYTDIIHLVVSVKEKVDSEASVSIYY